MIGQYKNKLSIIVVIGLSFLLFLTVGCNGSGVYIGKRQTHGYGNPDKGGPPPWAPAHGKRAKHKYRYYPSSHVYFEFGRKLYFYYDGGSWEAATKLPKWISLDIDNYVTFEMQTDKPYELHSEVVKNYPPGHQKKKSKGKNKGKGKKVWY